MSNYPYQNQQPQQPQPVYVNTTVNQKKGTSHGFHLLMTIITFGLWLPVWIIMAIVNN